MQGMDVGLFRSINGWPDSLSPFFRFFSEGNKDPVVVGILAVLLVALLWNKGTRKPTLLSLVAVVVANETCDFLKAWLQDPRPCNELADIHLRGKRLTSYGTASSHAANLAAVASVFVLRGVRWGWVWALAAFLNGLSRIYVGVHYPGQVLLGWCVGALAGLLIERCWFAVEAWQATDARQAEGRPAPDAPESQ